MKIIYTMSQLLKVFILLGIVVSINSCQDEIREDLPDVSHIDVDATIIRFDSDLASLDTNNLAIGLDSLSAKYPKLYYLYFDRVINLADKNPKIFESNVKSYISNANTKRVLDTVAVEFPDMNALQEEFSMTFKYLKYYFPDYNFPNLYAVVSDFGYQKFVFPDVDNTDGLAIGLDMFLGETFPYKDLDPQNPSFSDYLTRSFNKDHIVKKTVELHLDDLLGSPSGVRFLDLALFNGKKLYVLDKVLPFKSDTVIHEYTGSQMEWLQNNELQIWSYFVDENLLYETNQKIINKYLNPSPNSPGMPASAPGRTGNYIGWKIVQAYMNKFPETTIQDLLSDSDSQAFLEKARYRPK